jgi:GH25 family lysozyme M1 (1,4-beta-N-acetylmuramidase)
MLAERAHADTYIQGIDVYNGDGAVNWTTAKNAGIQFAFVKATEGVNFVDARFAANMQNANAAGVYVGPYHFCRVDSKNGVPFTSYDGSPFTPGSDPYLDATSEAIDFIDAIRPYYRSGYYLPPVADVEGLPDFGNASLNKTFISNWVQLFSDTVNHALGFRPMIYTSKSKANSIYTSAVAASHDLWIAWWKGTGTTSPPVPSDTPLWDPWLFWQWSATGSVAGVPGSGIDHDCDKDVFYGTMQQLTSLLVHNVLGDYNHDGVVDAADYSVWRDTRGSTTNLAADGNGNDQIDAGDYTVWKSHFGEVAGGGAGAAAQSSSAVPEPNSAVILLLALIVLVTKSRLPKRAR